MSEGVEDFFVDEYRGRGGFHRDGNENALIVPPGSDGTVRVPYTSASSLALYIANSFGLNLWKQRMTARAIAENEDLAAIVAGLRWTGVKAEDKITNALLDEVILRGMDRVGATVRANIGTAMHLYTDPGERQGPVPERFRDDVQAYEVRAEQFALVIKHVERSVVNDAIRGAGTYDYVARLGVRPDLGWMMTDKKTGEIQPFSFAVQSAVYVNGQHYDKETDERSPIGEINKRWGLIIHIPQGKAECDYYLIDLEEGWKYAQIAADARDAQQMSAAHFMSKLSIPAADGVVDMSDHVSALIQAANSTAELKGIYASWEPHWTEAHSVQMRQMMISEGHIVQATGEWYR